MRFRSRGQRTHASWTGPWRASGAGCADQAPVGEGQHTPPATAATAAHRLRQPLHRLIDVQVVGGVQQVVVAQPVLLQLRANGSLRSPADLGQQRERARAQRQDERTWYRRATQAKAGSKSLASACERKRATERRVRRVHPRRAKRTRCCSQQTGRRTMPTTTRLQPLHATRSVSARRSRQRRARARAASKADWGRELSGNAGARAATRALRRGRTWAPPNACAGACPARMTRCRSAHGNAEARAAGCRARAGTEHSRRAPPYAVHPGRAVTAAANAMQPRR